MPNTFTGTNGESGLAARALARGLPAPEVSPTLGTEQDGNPTTPLAGDGAFVPVDQSRVAESAAPAEVDDDFMDRIRSHMAERSDPDASEEDDAEETESDPPAASEPASEDEGSGTDGASQPATAEDDAPFSLPWMQPAPAPEPSAATPPTDPAPAAPAGVVIDGIAWTQDELRLAISAARERALWTPEQIAAVNAALLGQPAPAGQRAPAHDPYGMGDDDEPLDPRVAEQLQQQATQLAQLQAQQRQQQMLAAQESQRIENSRVESAMADVAKRYNLTEQDYERVAQAAGPFAQHAFAQAPTDPRTGAPLVDDTTPVYRWALEQAVYAIPDLRDAYLAQEAQRRADAQLASDELQAARNRKAKASSLAGSNNGSVPRKAAAPARDARNMSDHETRAAMTAALRAME